MRPNLSVIHFSSIEIPKFVEVRGKDWVNYGEDNLYPEKLIELKNSSAIHNTCLDAIYTGIFGEGLEVAGDTIVNTLNETLNDIYQKISIDFAVFKGYALNVIWNKAGDRIAEIYHLPFNKVRSGKMNEEDVVDTYFFSSNWKNTKKYIPIAYPAFSNTDTKGDMASQIYYYKGYSVGNDIYPLPTYIGAINDIQLDGRISVFHNSNISNGMSPGLIITFPNGDPTEDEKRKLWKDLNEAFASEKNAGKVFLNFTNSPEEAPTFQVLDSPNDDYYITLENRISSRILTSHKISSPLLLGIRDTGTGLGNNANELEVAYAHFIGVVIEPKQKEINKSLNKVVRSFGLNISLEIIPSKIDFNTITQ